MDSIRLFARCVVAFATVCCFNMTARADECPDPADPRVRYVANSYQNPHVCTQMLFECAEGETLFSRFDCGCGCIKEDATWIKETVTEGEPVVVELESNPSTGFAWRVFLTNRTFGYPREEYIPDEPVLTGSGGITRLTWSTEPSLVFSKVGTHQVVLQYSRLAEGHPARVVYLTAEVLEAVETCGDPDVMARFEACDAAEDADSCLAAGGDWGRAGLLGREMCICRTGQEACRCTSGEQCLSGHCIADAEGCSDSTEGYCGAYAPQFGCFCTLREGAGGAMICVD